METYTLLDEEINQGYDNIKRISPSNGPII